jgi:hypothetical protein
MKSEAEAEETTEKDEKEEAAPTGGYTGGIKMAFSKLAEGLGFKASGV